MSSFLRIAVVAATLLAVAGCAKPKDPTIPFDRMSGPEIKTIGVITAEIPDGPAVELASTVGQTIGSAHLLLGILAMIVDETMQANREDDLEEILAAAKFDAREKWRDKIRTQLESQNYIVTFLNVTREKKGKFQTKYPQSANVDAFLDIQIPYYGYIAVDTSDSTPYRPTMLANARLIRKSDSSILMEDKIYYGALQNRTNVNNITIAPDTSHKFVDFDGLTSHPKEAVSYIEASFDRSANAISRLLN